MTATASQEHDGSDAAARLWDLAFAYAAARGLSARETEVFTRFVLEGKASKEIAAELEIAYPTVKL
jgi:DNA-binding CsgD family transcriptional regulator